MCRKVIRLFGVLTLCALISGCAFLPGFGFFEQPTLYFLPVAEVANQVACELQEFMSEHEKYSAAYKNDKWVLAEEDVSVKLNLQTDESGYVNFTGINAAKLGFDSLAQLISTQSSAPSLGAKLSVKRTKTVQITFSVSPKALAQDLRYNPTYPYTPKTTNCLNWKQANNPGTRLYLRDWLNNYFETINFGSNKVPYSNTDPTDSILHAIRPVSSPQSVPRQFKIQSVELSTTILLAVDVSGGATPKFLGNGSVFIVPVSGLSFDYNPDYSHKIDITMNMCDNSQKDSPCHQKKQDKLTPLLEKQCVIYAELSPILSGVKPPKDAIDSDGKVRTCNKLGKYEVKKENM